MSYVTLRAEGVFVAVYVLGYFYMYRISKYV
jgi:hypothetical protein